MKIQLYISRKYKEKLKCTRTYLPIKLLKLQVVVHNIISSVSNHKSSKRKTKSYKKLWVNNDFESETSRPTNRCAINLKWN